MTTFTKSIIAMLVFLAFAGGYSYRVAQLNEHGTEKEHLLAQELEMAKESILNLNGKIKKDKVASMLNRLAQLEAKNERLDNAGELNYGNDPETKNFGACKQIGGWRLSECDTWTKYRWSIRTAQHFYNIEYGETITEKEMLIKLLDDEWLDEFTANTIINNQGAIWHWHGAKNDAKFFKEIIPEIREL